jgi:hypothetical protein
VWTVISFRAFRRIWITAHSSPHGADASAPFRPEAEMVHITGQVVSTATDCGIDLSLVQGHLVLGVALSVTWVLCVAVRWLSQ